MVLAPLKHGQHVPQSGVNRSPGAGQGELSVPHNPAKRMSAPPTSLWNCHFCLPSEQVTPKLKVNQTCRGKKIILPFHWLMFQSQRWFTVIPGQCHLTLALSSFGAPFSRSPQNKDPPFCMVLGFLTEGSTSCEHNASATQVTALLFLPVLYICISCITFLQVVLICSWIYQDLTSNPWWSGVIHCSALSSGFLAPDS